MRDQYQSSAWNRMKRASPIEKVILGLALICSLLVPSRGAQTVGRKLQQIGDPNQPQGANGNVSLPEEGSLFPPDLFSHSALSHGAVILHIIGILYMFFALALVCDEFFVPSLDVIIEKLGISPDVAGATFMAAGGSAPELFTSIIGVFIAKSDVGIGTIVGSAVFNILFVIAACAFAASTALGLAAWPLVRDVAFYSISLVLLVVFFLDNQITWYEALILFLWYGAYVCFMKFNEPVEDKLRLWLKLPPSERSVHGITLRSPKNRKGLFHLMADVVHPEKKPVGIPSQRTVEQGQEMEETQEKAQQAGITGLKSHLANGNEARARDDQTNLEDPQPEESNEDGPIDMSLPGSGDWKAIMFYVISFPIMAPLFITLPDTKNPSKRKYFVLTFVGSIVWIAIFSYLMVWWATVAGDVLGIPPEVMGLTFLAAGTSVPDLITSVLVAKQGKGDMAVSSSVGSNIFDVTVGLPLPWLIYSIVFGESVTVSSHGVACSILMLFSMLVLVFVSIVAFNWKMTKAMGGVMLVAYFVFVMISLGFTYDLYSCPF
ncbi:sodium/potassium/calcium exchanger Nckx30C-like [Tigriopus californicus]|uniref:sodium/potassium/calcium exchanger Nckx30C-like n=1 Tax=Tigriopus californicus TaxID=6832 RepID=UPI0027DA4C83|nr:sodium/potassium/calcium exchanger Nckx30C-like [Tigriopus californicus]